MHLLGGGAFTGGSVISSNSGITVLSGGSYSFNGTATGTNLIQNGGNLTNFNVIQGAFSWLSGSWNGAVITVTNNSVLNINNAGNNHLMPNCILTNYGTVNWSEDLLQGGGSAPGTFVFNYGLWNAHDDETMAANYGGNGFILNNYGMVRKSGTTGGSTQFGITLTNLGTMDIQTGIISLTGTNNLTSGALNFGLNSLTNYGRLSISGVASFGGSLNVNVGGLFVPALSNQFQIISSAGESGLFSSVSVPPGISVTYSNVGVIGAVPTQLLSPQMIGTNFSFHFATASGQSYTIQRNDDVTTTNWIFYTNIIGNGNVMTFQAPVAAIPAKRFFRVREP